MIQAFKALDQKVKKTIEFLVGGGAALLLAHEVNLTTHDVDGLILSSEMTPSELDPLIKQVGRELGIGAHWYNSYFSSFTYTLPKSFRSRLKQVYQGKKIKVWALGKEDLLIMKCFSGREKDIGHARALLRHETNVELVEEQLLSLLDKKLPGSEEALKFLHDLLDERGNP